jgi:hypothetical protein
MEVDTENVQVSYDDLIPNEILIDVDKRMLMV